MRQHDLPTPADIQHDLERIVHNLDELWSLRLDSLAALPTVRAWQPPPNTKLRPPTTEGERRAYAIEELIENLIPLQPYPEDRDALAALFTFGETDKTMKARHEDAGAAKGINGDAFRVSHESPLLSRLAVDVYRAQLDWCMQQIDFNRTTVHTSSRTNWWSLVEIDWSFSIPDDEPTTGVWDLRHVLRCVAPVAQPIAVMIIKWTGNGPRDASEIEPLSGPREGDTDAGFPHKLLNLRPSSPSSVADTAYIWDLGNPLLAGDEVELTWRQRLTDRALVGQPFIGASTAYKPDLRYIRLRANVPDAAVVQPHAEIHSEHSLSTSSYEAPWVKLIDTTDIDRDSDGYFTYIPDPITTGHRYELWWGPRAGRALSNE